MALYVFVSDNEMIDAAQIRHMVYKPEGILIVEFGGDHKIELNGPYAHKVFNAIKARLKEDNQC